MKALFFRKVYDLETLRDLTKKGIKNHKTKDAFEVTKEVFLDDEGFNDFSSNFFNSKHYYENADCGETEEGVIKCIRVIKESDNTCILVNTEGFSYARYVAIEVDKSRS